MRILTSPLDSAAQIPQNRAIIWRPDHVCMCFLLASRKSAVFLFHLMTLNIYHMKFEVDESIRSWLITFLLLIRYVTLWPWLLTLQPWMFIVYRLSRIQTFYQIHRNPTIRGWFIDDWTNIFFLFLRGGQIVRDNSQSFVERSTPYLESWW